MLNEARAKAARMEELQKDKMPKELPSHTDNIGQRVGTTVQEFPVTVVTKSNNRVHLKGVELPIFTGEG